MPQAPDAFDADHADASRPKADNPWIDPKSDRSVGKTELFTLLFWVVVADLAIYRSEGFAGWAAFTASAPLLVLFARRQLPKSALGWWIGFLLLLVSLKLLWLGTWPLAVCGLVLTLALAMELAGITPFVMHVPIFLLHLLAAGLLRLEDYAEGSINSKWMIPRERFLQIGIPLAVVFGFSTIFIMANPDVARMAGETISRFAETIGRSLSRFAPTWGEAVFWVASAWLFAGMLKPVMAKTLPDSIRRWRNEQADPQSQPIDSPLLTAFANTLIAVIALFVLYLGFEFHTLWRREFPKGFHYSGYAHEGAAWLTVALALATLLLSVIFRGEVMRDHRLPKLRRLAWIWSGLNLLLAVAVYHRLSIYVGFNGMTRMRTIGFLGISSVALGFLLVIRKITRGEDFLWLIRRQSWVLAFAVILYLVLPVDALVHRYNAKRILAGDPAPSVQISVHPIDAGGLIELVPLMDADDPIIREGIRALLAEKARDSRKTLESRDDWSSYQRAEEVLARELNRTSAKWKAYKNPTARQSALSEFDEYAYQWY